MKESKIISALIGLVGACNNNPKTGNTDLVVLKALALPLIHPEADNGSFLKMIEEIHAEKYAVSPGCATCQTPCGNTSDYDMDRIDNAGTDIRNIKLEILSALEELAADIYRHEKADVLSQESMEIFYKALAYVSFDMEMDGMTAFKEEVKETIQAIRRDLQV